ncbi:MAG: hypothetical protein A3I29_04970 [Candidatus Magasanikbacteria bacterium RIFCSPLOWO2_02_FULL_44_11]|uniref:Bifunctional protein FolD n=2 Tax=Candidatus Magasanikiibacteriota TaxID=1752731 RepID=A0A1F6NA60_9BACT|nr:MAG: hypothetical protein A3D53_02295 [Candidatus Magasanikbacteria bacterium RIFCSPHIGHO2_02_FULL_45_10]OGH80806.1 MAG: hypothetical protein A3I29_04970 [Candidatus Magasanikbacteria bacterium RIFCSPLOWO2_02_FULL_44_11]
MTTIIDGKAIAKKIEQDVQKRVNVLRQKGISPKLHVILVGDNQASQTYTHTKAKAAERVGIDFTLHNFPATISEDDLIASLQKIQADGTVSGLIIQIPLPEHLYTEKVINSINPKIDIDCLTNTNLGRLVMNQPLFTPPTPTAALRILDEIAFNPKGKNITIIGTGALVGKPLAIMLINAGASVTTINSRTTNSKEKCLSADVIISGVGKKNIVTAAMVKPGAIVIDTGFVYENGILSGDVDFDAIKDITSYITPTPGGVGPITVAELLLNTVKSAELN